MKLRRVIKKFIVFFIIIIIVLSSTSCGTRDVEQVSASIITHSIEQAIKKTDIIAQVEISQKLGKTKFKSGEYTFFEVKVIDVFKGNEKVNSKIKIICNGSDKYVFNGVPVSTYENGNKYIMFLYKVSDSTDYYAITGTYTGAFRCIELDGIEIVYRIGNSNDDFNSILDADLTSKVEQYRQNSRKQYETYQFVKAFRKDDFINKLEEEIKRVDCVS